MADLLYLLNIIWESPYGLFPVGKRVAIGVMADMVSGVIFDLWPLIFGL